jgi:hypothetical protein
MNGEPNMATRKSKVEAAEPTPKTAKRKLSDDTIAKVADTMTPKKPTVKKAAHVKSAKEIATEAGEPYVSINSIELDPDNVGNGAFELDWNDQFIVKLVRAGYQSKPNESEDIIIDRWFQTICKNIAMENYEQWEANQPYDTRPRIIDRKDLGDGRSEAS